MSRPLPTVLERRQFNEGRRVVEELDLEFSNGEQRTYFRVPAPEVGAVAVVALDDQDRLLLVREYACGLERYELGLVKGRIDAGEDILTAANRELMEEAGVGAHRLNVVRVLSLAPTYMQQRTAVVLARELYPQTLPGDEPEPLEVVHWPLAGLDDLVLSEEFSEGRSLAALYAARAWLTREAQA